MYDLIIIGGGPSGSAAGRLAGFNGLRTLLIEQNIFPRYKPCGGAFSEQAMSYLDFEIPQYIQETDVFGARVHYRGRSVESHKKYRIATLVTRSVLDDYLLKRAKETGIEVKTGEKVLSFEEHDNRVEVQTQKNAYEARFVIVAEGAQGRLKNRIRKKDGKSEYAICMVTEIKEDAEKINRYIGDSIDIHFGVVKRGYGWIFPHEKYFSVGIGGLASTLANPKRKMMDFLNNNGFGVKHKLKAHLIPVGGINRKNTSSRVVLAGDAAGFVDAFYGEGIAYAIRSGQVAVEVISKILCQGLGRLVDYELICKNEFGENLKYSLRLSKLMHCCPGIFFRIFASNDEVLGKYLEVPALRCTYRSYLSWLMLRLPKYLFFKSPA